MTDKTQNPIYTVSHSKSGGELFEIDWNKVPAANQEFIIAYGFKQFLDDKTAGCKDGEAAAKKIVESYIERIYHGDLGTRAGRESDPIKAEMKATATKIVLKMYKAKGIKADDIDAKVLSANVTAYVQKYESTLRPAAEKVVEARKTAISMPEDFELEGLE